MRSKPTPVVVASLLLLYGWQTPAAAQTLYSDRHGVRVVYSATDTGHVTTCSSSPTTDSNYSTERIKVWRIRLSITNGSSRQIRPDGPEIATVTVDPNQGSSLGYCSYQRLAGLYRIDGQSDQRKLLFGIALGVQAIAPGRTLSNSTYMYLYEHQQPALSRWQFLGYTFLGGHEGPRSAAIAQEPSAITSAGNRAVVDQQLQLDRTARGQIQDGLRSEGFDPGPTDGLFGPRTRRAIQDWQTARGARATGYLTADQMAELRAPHGLASPALPEARSNPVAPDDPPGLAGFARLAEAIRILDRGGDAAGTPTSRSTAADPPQAPIRITSHQDGDRVAARIIEITGEADADVGDDITVQFAEVEQNARLTNGRFRSSVVLRSGPNEIRVCQESRCSTITIHADIAALGLMATLSWSGGGDLDLHVQTPLGDHCYYSAKSAPGACELDIDDREGVNPENMSIPADGERGQYRFWVENYFGADGSSGRLTIYREGAVIESTSFAVDVGAGDTVLTRTVDWPAEARTRRFAEQRERERLVSEQHERDRSAPPDARRAAGGGCQIPGYPDPSAVDVAMAIPWCPGAASEPQINTNVLATESYWCGYVYEGHRDYLRALRSSCDLVDSLAGAFGLDRCGCERASWYEHAEIDGGERAPE